VLVKQRNIVNVRIVALIGLIVAAIVTSLVLHSSAQAAENPANVLKVMPVRSDVSINPGETKTVKTTVTNLTSAPLSIHPVTNDFIAGDERGTPALILDDNKYAPTHSLKRFMQPLADVTIPAKESKVIEVTISVPKDAQAGGYFGAVRFVPSSPEGGQVNLNASVASIMLLTVPGDMVEQLRLTEFNVQQNGQSNGYFRTPDNIQVTFRLENKGNAQSGPFGKISLQKGKDLVYETDFNNNDPRDMVLPDSARRWDVPLKNIEAFGHYTVTATFTYGQKNQTIEVTKSFWVIPLPVLIGAIAGAVILLLVIAFVIWKIVTRGRRGNSMRLGR